MYWNSAEIMSLFTKMCVVQTLKCTYLGAVVQWLSLLHNFIQQNLNSGSAQVQILLATCRRFAMVRISDNGPDWLEIRLNAFRRSTMLQKQFIISIMVIPFMIRQIFPVKSRNSSVSCGFGNEWHCTKHFQRHSTVKVELRLKYKIKKYNMDLLPL